MENPFRPFAPEYIEAGPSRISAAITSRLYGKAMWNIRRVSELFAVCMLDILLFADLRKGSDRL
jgi:hypothetical protein